MKTRIYPFLIAASLLFLAPGFGAEKTSPRPGLQVRVAPYIQLERDTLKGLLEKDIPENHSVEVVIYHFTEGMEVISYSGEGFDRSSSRGDIRALLKVFRDDVPRMVSFTRGRGSGRQELIRDLSRSIREKLADLEKRQP
jgi:hypothetical protein